MPASDVKICTHDPDFYPSIMRWQCKKCGAYLRIEGDLHAAFRDAIQKQSSAQKEVKP